MEVKANQGGTDTFARLKKDHPLKRYSLEELRSEFHKLTGDTMQSICVILGQEESLDVVRRIMHFAILHANNIGTSKGQPLSEHIASAQVA